MRVVREDVNPCTVNLTVTCSPEQVDAGVKKAIKALSKRVRVPGFRPGTAPLSVIEQMTSPEHIDELAKEETVNITFKSAIAAEGLEMVGQASIVGVVFDRAAAKCEYTVKVPLAPKVALGEYKGLLAEKFKVTVAEDEIDRQIDELRSRSGTKKAVQRGIKKGDNALINIKVDGEDGEGRNFVVVAGQTFEDLDKSLEGMSPDDIKSASLGFPEGFQEADLAGRTVQCTITVKNVSAVEMPELDDEFAKTLNLTNLDQLRENIRQYIQNAKGQMATEMLHERLLEQVMALSEVHVPDTYWENVAERRVASIKKESEDAGSSFAEVAERNGMTEEKFMDVVRDQARAEVHRAQVVDKIFRLEGLTITTQDVNAQFLRIVRENQIPENELKRFAKENARAIQQEVSHRAMYAKVLTLLEDTAVVSEVDLPTGSGNPEARGGRR